MVFWVIRRSFGREQRSDGPLATPPNRAILIYRLKGIRSLEHTSASTVDCVLGSSTVPVRICHSTLSVKGRDIVCSICLARLRKTISLGSSVNWGTSLPHVLQVLLAKIVRGIGTTLASDRS